jgi:hypothetical protein
MIIESRAILTAAQQLLCHTGPRLTANIYSHARQDRLQSIAEAVGAKVFPTKKYAQSLHLNSEMIAIEQAKLAQVVEVWFSLPEHVRTAISALVVARKH